MNRAVLFAMSLGTLTEIAVIPLVIDAHEPDAHYRATAPNVLSSAYTRAVIEASRHAAPCVLPSIVPVPTRGFWGALEDQDDRVRYLFLDIGKPERPGETVLIGSNFWGEKIIQQAIPSWPGAPNCSIHYPTL